MLPACKSQSGVSLVEIMVSLVIVGMLAVVGLPSMQNMMSEARVSAQSDQLVAILNQARGAAIKEGRVRGIDLSGVGTGPFVMRVCPGADPNAATACSNAAGDWSKGILIVDNTGIVHRAQVGQGVVITSAATAIDFTNAIGAARAATSWTICATGVRQQQVSVSLVGRVSKQINATVCP